MRRSHQGLNTSLIIKDSYEALPAELFEFGYYYKDGDTGHVVMAIPRCLLDEAEKNGDLDMFECPIPCKYVLEQGYELYKDHVVVDVPYGMFGAEVDRKYFEP